MPQKKRAFAVRDVTVVFLRHIGPYRLVVLTAMFFMTTTWVLDIIIPLFYKKLLDTLGANVTTPLLAAPILISILITIALLDLSGWVTRRIGQFASIYSQSRIMNDLMRSAFDSLLEHSYGFFTNNFTGSLVRRVTRLSRSFEDVSDKVLFDLLPISVTLVGIVIVLASRNTILGVIYLLWAVLLIGFQIIIARYKMQYNLDSAEKDSEVTGALSDTLSNETSVKLYVGSKFEHDRIGSLAVEQHVLRTKAWRFDEYVNAAQGLLMIGIEFALMYASILLWEKGLVTIGDFALIQSYLVTSFIQLWNFGGTLRRIFAAIADATEMVDIMNLPREIIDIPAAPELQVTEGKIEFRDVSFMFNQTRTVLDNFNLAIAGQEKIALVGPSGAGKTTITKLLLRFYDVAKGGIYIDGQNIAHVTQDSLRNAIALVPQEPILFHRTLMENIRYGRRGVTDAEVIEAAKQAHCYEFISKYPEGFETYVGERGVKLSGGERQRVAIARAILKNAPILILDEATSSLDSESEALIQDALAKLMRGKTVIAIAHRLSTIMKMDRIIVMEEGRIALTGAHAELLAQESNLYKRLWEIQAGGFMREDE